MLEKILSSARRTVRATEASPAGGEGALHMEEVRAVATEAALATAVEASPAILVALWAQGQRLHPELRCPHRRTG
jgi:hypothetical protein